MKWREMRSGGKVVGSYSVPSDQAWVIGTIREFLCRVTKQESEQIKQEREQVKNEEEVVNMVFLAGKLKFDPRQFDNKVSVLIDVGLKSCIQVGVNAGLVGLCQKMLTYRAGDFIRLKALLTPFATKTTEGWKNGLSVDVVEIKELPQPAMPSPHSLPVGETPAKVVRKRVKTTDKV